MLLLSSDAMAFALVIWLLAIGLFFTGIMRREENEKELAKILITISLLLMIAGCGVCSASMEHMH